MGAPALLLDLTKHEGWTVGMAEELYAVRNWGKGYFGVNELGHVTVHPDKNPSRALDLKALVDDIRLRGLHPPMLLRFTGILEHRLHEMAEAFRQAKADCGYKGDYCCVFPVKVNPQRHVVQQIIKFGQPLGFGVEAGSKPELLAVLALTTDDATPIICNGFKDAEYIETVILAQKLGKLVIPVVEKFSELNHIVKLASQHSVRPILGVRSKLYSRGAGKWESSGGQGSKFGLSTGELLNLLEFLRERGLEDCLKLLHFHIGSQVTNIRKIKDAINEAARVYSELYKAGAGLKYLDVGGGLGIDYDGSQTNFGSSVNYTLSEYANDVTFTIQSICDHAGVPHPTIISESGRAVVAYHSVLVFNVLGTSEVAGEQVPARPAGKIPQPLANLYDTLTLLSAKNVVEMFHDSLKFRDDALNLFTLGYMSLAERSLAEQLFWRICHEVRKITQRMEYVPEDLQTLDKMLSDTFYCNYSLFQSMPDSWAIRQLFPIMPLHRLGDRPDRIATLADITCDSDGKIDRFIDLRDVKDVLELHSPNGDDYYLGAFLVGAYQEILGDLHNLFGDTHAVHISLGDNGQPIVDAVIKGDTVREVLQYVQFSAEELMTRLRTQVETAVRSERIAVGEAGKVLRFFELGLEGYTYLE